MSYRGPNHQAPNLQVRSIAITPEMLNPFSVGLYDIARKGYLLPVALVLLIFTVGSAEIQIGATATLLSVGIYCYFYSLCGKRKPWWVALGVGAVMAFLISPHAQPLLWEPYAALWHNIYPQEVDPRTSNLPFPELAFQNFFGVGLREEIFKSIAVFLAFFVGKNASEKYGKYIRITEPLDGILLAIASGLGFAISETFYLYAPLAASGASKTLQQVLPANLAVEMGYFYAFYLTFIRSVFVIAGHAAFSGYLGYFIGMGAMKPRQRWKFFCIGLLWAAALHACWDAATRNPQAPALIGVVSYAGLIAAILQARRISPVREENFATQAYYSTRAKSPAPPPPAFEWELRAVSGVLAGRSYPVANRLLLGRDPERCDVVLNHGGDEVSRRHCEVTVEGGALLLEDCGSSNGTYLSSGDRLPVGDSRRLYDGDRFYVGTKAIVFEVSKRA